MDKNGVKVLSERTLDNKTIQLTNDKMAIEVKLSQSEGNVVKTKEDGIFVSAGTVATDLAGNPIGKLVDI